jgi:Coenzyme PQQ synthesis protein D (PqqD)
MLPVARHEGIHVEQLPDEVIAYDLASHKAHCLSPTAASVWHKCDGQNTAEDIAAKLQKEGIKADEEMVWMVLHRLSKLGLLEEKIVLPEDAIVSSRREMIKKAAMFGGVMFLLTTTITAPTPAQASSGGGQGGGENRHHRHHHHEGWWLEQEHSYAQRPVPIRRK